MIDLASFNFSPELSLQRNKKCTYFLNETKEKKGEEKTQWDYHFQIAFGKKPDLR